MTEQLCDNPSQKPLWGDNYERMGMRFLFSLEDIDVWLASSEVDDAGLVVGNSWFRLQGKHTNTAVTMEDAWKNSRTMTVEQPFWQTMYAALRIAGYKRFDDGADFFASLET